MDENQQKAHEFIRQANEFFGKKLWVQAASCYEEAISLYKPYCAYYLVLGECYFNNKDYKAAEDIFRRLVDLSPKHDQAWWMLGQAVMMQNRFPEAEQLYEEAIALGATDVEPYYYGAQMKHLRQERRGVSTARKSNGNSF